MTAGKATGKTDERRKRQFCTFMIGERLFGVDILDVKEINPETGFTPIFHAPREIRGYVNIRGQIHLILDLRLLMGLERKSIDAASRLILFKPNVGVSFGVLVDSVGDVVEVEDALIEDRRKTEKGAPEHGDRRTSDIGSGVCKLKDELMVILNSRNLLGNLGE
jgi:chemotaxis signal transduction protein